MEFKRDYAKYYDLFNSCKNYSDECNFLEKIFKKYSLKQIKSILDLGCGTGMHDIELTKRGYVITGIDLSEEMIQIAKEREKNINFIVGDMSNFKLEGKFDAVICMFSSIGYLTENNQIENFFKTVKNNLNKDGLLIIDCWNGLGVMKNNPSSRTKESVIEKLKIIRQSFPIMNSKDHTVNVNFDVKISEEDKLIDSYQEEHLVRFFFPKELEKYMADEEFELLKVCPAYNIDEELSEKNWNMVLIARLK